MNKMNYLQPVTKVPARLQSYCEELENKFPRELKEVEHFLTTVLENKPSNTQAEQIADFLMGKKQQLPDKFREYKLCLPKRLQEILSNVLRKDKCSFLWSNEPSTIQKLTELEAKIIQRKNSTATDSKILPKDFFQTSTKNDFSSFSSSYKTNIQLTTVNQKPAIQKSEPDPKLTFSGSAKPNYGGPEGYQACKPTLDLMNRITSGEVPTLGSLQDHPDFGQLTQYQQNNLIESYKEFNLGQTKLMKQMQEMISNKNFRPWKEVEKLLTKTNQKLMLAIRKEASNKLVGAAASMLQSIYKNRQAKEALAKLKNNFQLINLKTLIQSQQIITEEQLTGDTNYKRLTCTQQEQFLQLLKELNLKELDQRLPKHDITINKNLGLDKSVPQTEPPSSSKPEIIPKDQAAINNDTAKVAIAIQ